MTPYSNPLTRNRTFPTVHFAKSEFERKNLQVPVPKFSYQEALEIYRNIHVPQQEDNFSKIGAFGVKITRDGTRIIQAQSPHGNWDDPWGRDDFRKENEINKRSAEYAKRSQIENAKLLTELEKDQFRKQLLADIDNGKYFPKSRLKEVKN